MLFLRNVQGSFAENQKLQLLRSTYQKAVATPLLGVESVWKEYNQFENVSIVTITDSSRLSIPKEFVIFSLWKHIGNNINVHVHVYETTMHIIITMAAQFISWVCKS